jgi:serine phosphatase RsbU (regulator of sigma subunit)
MSQMKGIFHSLAQNCIEPDHFMIKANQALIHCLERGSFISASFFLINKEQRKVRYARAGHCPVLYHDASENTTEYLKDKGIALGMVRNSTYMNFIQTNEFSYSSGDVLVLYTDGITEAKNNKNEEFGMERLAQVVEKCIAKTPKEMEEFIISSLYAFSGSDLNDDYTTMIVKFN